MQSRWGSSKPSETDDMPFPFRSIAICAFALALTACATNRNGLAYQPPQAGVAIVDLSSGFRFKPETLAIRAGQTVEWRNRSIETHTVTGMGFDSGDIKPGEVFRHTFSAPGRYDYVCKPHHSLGMKGTVVVS
jgi:plastocyanin